MEKCVVSYNECLVIHCFTHLPLAQDYQVTSDMLVLSHSRSSRISNSC
jgi:hypothetical protein